MEGSSKHTRAWGLTGSIGSGKSSAARILRTIGIPVLDMDLTARRLMEPGTPVFSSIVKEFGDGVVRSDGRLNRAVLAQIVFADPERRIALEHIVHPPTLLHAFTIIESPPLLQVPMVFIESALIFAIGLDSVLAGTVLVTAPREIRLRRVMTRDQASTKDVKARMTAQIEDAALINRADAVWDNSGGLVDLRRQVIRTIAEGGGLKNTSVRN